MYEPNSRRICYLKMENLENEIWKEITELDNVFSISNLGRIRRNAGEIKVGSWGGVVFKETHLIKQRQDRLGYLRIKLSINNTEWRYSSHRLVAKYFVVNPENKPEVNHKNGIKTDNKAINLEWCTRSENMLHADKNGLRVMPKGGEHGMAKEILNLETGIYYGTIREAANAHGLHESSLQHFLSGRRCNKTSLVSIGEKKEFTTFVL